MCRSSSSFFPSGFLIKVLPHVCYMPCPSHHPWLHCSNSSWRRIHIAPRCAVFSNFLPLQTTLIQTFPSAPCSETHTVWVVSLMSETSFHTHRKQWTSKWWSCRVSVGHGANNSSLQKK
jgi:hypothetical protein